MKGDFTRSTFRPDKHYASVRMQQGRVQLDADWNEQAAISAHRDEVATLDVIGESGGSRQTAGFALARSSAELPKDQRPAAKKLEPLQAGDFFISPGRYYVDGILCENEHLVTFARQPDGVGGGLPDEPGVYLAFLDVWQRHLTALDDPEIVEVALGGPDTATRTKTVWQVKLMRVNDEGAACGSVIPKWEDQTAPSSGRLSARAEAAATTDDPCLLEPDAGYRRIENQLYRVEIHETKGTAETATFKWSRDNGSVVAACVAQSGNDLTVSSVGKDKILGFARGDSVELTDDTNELQGLPGVLVKVVDINGQIITIDPGTSVVELAQFPLKPKVRRWNMGAAGALPVKVDGFIELEDGVQVKFEPGTYRTGDYWLIPARTATGGIEWPFTEPQFPQGIIHHYCRLGLLTFDRTQYTSIQDCRQLSPPVTELTSLFYVGGDGQVAAPGQMLPQLLQVGAAIGQWPKAGATVRFTITQGSGTLQSAETTVDVVTTEDGIASCAWRLGFGTQSQQVEATLLDPAKTPVHLPVRFNASFSEDAQDAGIQVEKIVVGDGSILDNDADVAVDRLADGIGVICSASIAPGTVGRATCFLTMEMPFPITLGDTIFWGKDLIGYQPLVVAAIARVVGSMVVWTPTEAVSAWLQNDLFRQIATLDRFPRVLARLTILGNFIWQSDKPEMFLDADAFGRQVKPGALEPTRLQLPSGDGRRGGRLDMWFWVIPPVTISIAPEAVKLTVLPGRPVDVMFTVTIEGTVNKSAELSVNGIVGGNSEDGTISLDETRGVWTYRSPANILLKDREVKVAATSLGDPTRVALATVTLLSPV